MNFLSRSTRAFFFKLLKIVVCLLREYSEKRTHFDLKRDHFAKKRSVTMCFFCLLYLVPHLIQQRIWDLIINNQQDTIESLKAQVGLLNTFLSSTSLNIVAGSLQQTSKCIESYSDVIKNQSPLKNNAIEIRENKPNVDNVSKIIQTDNSKSIKIANHQKSKMNKILDINSDLSLNNSQSINTVIDIELSPDNADFVTVSNE
ncbi:hypothetical protein RN001_014249 [Aquatica leii]|uniref:Uncharacterized protein n=1 Tax=Aquatica leii TaxID=1421715 RepID=A0AAN7SEG0_9COLE|nr:hypothetical protein RN001_014249 [Aquatica leii]